ncbi:MAG: dTDP-4-dehydrorhamnose reductase [Verrucomicrobiota bacterium]
MKIVIIGSGGRLGAALMREFADKFDLTGFNHAQLDLADAKQIHTKIDNLDFGVLINSAAFTNVDLCEKERDQAFAINAEAPRLIAEICRDKNAKFIHISTDYVFDGENREPYVESDPANPISVYGESKRAGEENVLAVQDGHLVVRVSWVFGPDRPSFVDGVIKRARDNEQVDAIADKFATPTYTLDIAQALLSAVATPNAFDAERGKAGASGPGYSGILHFANAGECSWKEYAQYAIDCCHELGVPIKARTVAPLKLADMKNFIARRPVYSVLSTAKYAGLAGAAPRSWRDAVAEYVRQFVER